MLHLNQQKTNMPNTREEIEQLAQVVDFKNTFPKEGLWWSYEGKDEFRKLVRNHLTQFIRTISVSDGTSNNSNTIPIEMKDEQASLAAQELENRGVVSNDRDEEQFDGTNELTESLQLEENMLNMSALPVHQVNDAWEKVVKRTRQKTPSGTIAAMLRLYKILDVEGTAEQPIVVIQSEKQAHYKYVKDEDRYKILEWALEMEFSLPCQVRLIPPGQPLPAAPRSDSAIYATRAAPTIAPQVPAHLERPVTLSPNPPEEIPGAGMQTPISQLAQPGYEDSPFSAASLAITNIVRENTSVASHEDAIEQKVLRDPVVQEVMKTFSARIEEVHRK